MEDNDVYPLRLAWYLYGVRRTIRKLQNITPKLSDNNDNTKPNSEHQVENLDLEQGQIPIPISSVRLKTKSHTKVNNSNNNT